IAGLLWAAIRVQPPTPLPANAPADQFSAGRAMADVRVLAREPHPTGTPAAAAVIVHLESRLAALGFVVRRVVTPLPERPAKLLAKRGGDPSQPAISLVAVRAGRAPGKDAIALMAHHDSVWASPGAADDIAGVASALEIARAIPAASQQRDLVLLFTDAEELGLVGARAILAPGAAADPIAEQIGVLINLEARGGGGRAMMFQTGKGNAELVRLLARSTPMVDASSLAVTVYESLPNDTDFTPGLERGMAGLNFAFIGEAWGYHSPMMTPDRLDQGGLQHLGESGLGITRALLTADALPVRDSNAVFANAPLLGLLVYLPPMGWALLGLATAMVVIAAWRRRADWTVSGQMLSIGQAVLVLILSGVLMWGLNLLSGSVGAEYYDRLAALPRLEAVAGLAALAVLLVTASAPAGKLWERWLGWVLLCLLGTLALQVWLPGATPILLWPTLLAAAGMLIASGSARPGMLQLGLAVVLAVPGIVFVAELAHFLMLGVGAPTPYAAAPLLLPVLALVAPLLPDGPVLAGQRRPAQLAAGAAVLLAAGLALWVNLDPVAPSVPPYAGTEKSQG
uniref:M20/M25/M40 family metallo-hydrolase n=1 Tax=Sandarakinorhabdus sp. TaxID=1916663 RepID=UPI00286DE690